MPCFVVTIDSIPSTMKVLIQAYGAAVMTVKRHEDRWPVMRLLVEKFGSFPLSSMTDPPAGSNPYAVEGYRTIAYEIAESFGDAPDWIAMPTCYADGLWGVAKGLADLSAAGHAASRTRMIAAEVAGSLQSSISSGSPDPVVVPVSASPAFSINTPRSTHQGLEALRRTNGIAVATEGDDLIGWQSRLAVSEGIFVEAAAVVGLPAVARLRRKGHIRPNDRVVVVLTSSGLKDPAVIGVGLPPIPAIEPNQESLVSIAKEVYGLNLVEMG
jgi:threonine synthase